MPIQALVVRKPMNCGFLRKVRCESVVAEGDRISTTESLHKVPSGLSSLGLDVTNCASVPSTSKSVMLVILILNVFVAASMLLT